MAKRYERRRLTRTREFCAPDGIMMAIPLTCRHAHWESEAAVADGMCPICLAAEIEQLQAALKPFADMATIALRTPGDCAHGTMTVAINHLLFAKGVLERKFPKAEIERLRAERDDLMNAGIERFHLPEGKTWKDVKWGTLFLAFKDGTFDSLDYDERPQDTASPDAAEDKSLGATIEP